MSKNIKLDYNAYQLLYKNQDKLVDLSRENEAALQQVLVSLSSFFEKSTFKNRLIDSGSDGIGRYSDKMSDMTTTFDVALAYIVNTFEAHLELDRLLAEKMGSLSDGDINVQSGQTSSSGGSAGYSSTSGGSSGSSSNMQHQDINGSSDTLQTEDKLATKPTTDEQQVQTQELLINLMNGQHSVLLGQAYATSQRPSGNVSGAPLYEETNNTIRPNDKFSGKTNEHIHTNNKHTIGATTLEKTGYQYASNTGFHINNNQNEEESKTKENTFSSFGKHLNSKTRL